MATHTIKLGVDGSGISRNKEVGNTQAGVSLIDGEEVGVVARHATKEFMNQIKLQYISDNRLCLALDREGG